MRMKMHKFKKLVSFGVAFDWFFYLMKIEVDFFCWRIEVIFDRKEHR